MKSLGFYLQEVTNILQTHSTKPKNFFFISYNYVHVYRNFKYQTNSQKAEISYVHTKQVFWTHSRTTTASWSRFRSASRTIWSRRDSSSHASTSSPTTSCWRSSRRLATPRLCSLTSASASMPSPGMCGGHLPLYMALLLSFII